jgi:hypothetical protein
VCYTFFAMKALALTVLLAVMQASPPIPRQTANKPASTGGTVQRQPKAKQKPTAQPPPSTDTKQTPYDDATGNGQGTDNAQHSVSITELPAVTVKEHKRDWADWGYWAFNLGLVVVGALQVVLLCWTLQAIRRQAITMSQQRLVMVRQWRAMREQVSEIRGQAAEMKEQTDILEKSVKAAQDNAAAAKASADALINSERAWVMADIKWSADVAGLTRSTQLRVVNGSGEVSADICLIYQNDGKTPAWITEKRIILREVSALQNPPDYTPDATGDAFTLVSEPLTVQGTGKYCAILTCKGNRELGKTLVVYGFIKYRDVFSPDRETRFGYVITPETHFQRIAGKDDFWQYNRNT